MVWTLLVTNCYFWKRKCLTFFFHKVRSWCKLREQIYIMTQSLCCFDLLIWDPFIHNHLIHFTVLKSMLFGPMKICALLNFYTVFPIISTLIIGMFIPWPWSSVLINSPLYLRIQEFFSICHWAWFWSLREKWKWRWQCLIILYLWSNLHEIPGSIKDIKTLLTIIISHNYYKYMYFIPVSGIRTLNHQLWSYQKQPWLYTV